MAPSAPGPCGAAAFVSGAPLAALPQRRPAAGTCPVGARTPAGAPAARRGARAPHMGPDTAAAAAAAAPAGVDAPLEPVPSRAGRVKVRRGWSNVTGELIRRVCDDVWVVERACTWGLGSGGRCLRCEALWLPLGGGGGGGWHARVVAPACVGRVSRCGEAAVRVAVF